MHRLSQFPAVFAAVAISVSLNGEFAVGQDNRTDRDIRLAVESELIVDDAVPWHRLDVSTEDGIVTLSGSVDSYRAIEEAVEAVESVRGVRGVVNEMEVATRRRLDAEIRNDIVTALVADPVTESFDIGVRVDDGRVTLSGEVDSYTEKTVAEDLAEGVRGVTGVTNSITYEVEPGRADKDIAADIQRRLKSDASIDSGLIAVTVNNGHVTLSGSVASSAEKTEAESEAWMVLGVEEVTNHLDVDYEYTAKSDREIAEDIEDQLWWSPFVDSDDIAVDVNAGVATLFGSVDDWGELQAAKENARQGGAKSVISKLEIRSGGLSG